MEKSLCRMCGKLQNTSIVIDEELKNMIEYHCRIVLNLEDTKYPCKVCSNCNNTITKFAKFTEIAKEVQLKFNAQFQEVKVEIEELPLILEFGNTKNVRIFVDEPKDESNRNDGNELNDDTINEVNDNDDEVVAQNVNSKSNAGSDFDNEGSSDSDSDYVGNKYYKKRKKPVKHRRIRVKRARTSNLDEEIAILNEIPEEDRYKNGSIKKKSLSMYDGKKWSEMKVSCIECNQECLGPYELRKHHFKYHSLESNFKCFECPDTPDSTLTYFYQYLNHVHQEHQKFLKFCCVLCSEIFWNTKSLNAHYDTHDKADRTAIFHCLRCGQYFRKAFDLSTHESRVHMITQSTDENESKGSLITMESLFEDELKFDSIEQKASFTLPDEDKNADGSLNEECIEKFKDRLWNDVTVYQCSHCSASCTSVYLLYEHYLIEHLTTKNTYVCKICIDHKTFLNMESFINHTFTIHHEHLRYFCFICNAGYWNYKSMYEHYKEAHEDYKSFICLYCGKYHKCGYDIRHHKEVHSVKNDKEKQSKSFNCSICTKSFERQNQLQRHLETHEKNDGKVWICETCGKSFAAKSTLINHGMVHMTTKPFVCLICGEGFKNKYKLKHHKGIHTGERNFGCEICGQKFRAKGTLKGHMLTHTGERNWSCEYCDKKFAAKYDLMVHTRLHTGDFTHECEICHERYPSWSNYSKHMRGRHQIDPRSEKKKKYDALHKGIQDVNETIIDQSSSSSQYYQM